MINVVVTGNVTKDAEIRKAGNDNVTGFGVASNAKVKGEKVTTFVDATIWGRRGDALAPYIKKGQPVTLIGELTTREHQGKTYLGVRVDHIELQGKAGGSSASGGSASPKAAPQPADDGGDDDSIPF